MRGYLGIRQLNAVGWVKCYGNKFHLQVLGGSPCEKVKGMKIDMVVFQTSMQPQESQPHLGN